MSFELITRGITFVQEEIKEQQEQRIKISCCNYHGKVEKPILEPETQILDLKPTLIQQWSVPCFKNKYDVLACSPTGSGKTLAFLYPIQNHRALIVVPTLELANQIYDASQIYFKDKPLLLTSATPPLVLKRLRNQKTIIATPKSLLRELNNLDLFDYLVLDEADKLLELNYQPQIDVILQHCRKNPNLHVSMFTATLSSTLEALAMSALGKTALRLVVGQINTASANVQQHLCYVQDEDSKLKTLRMHIQNGTLEPPVLVFVQSVQRAKKLYNELKDLFPQTSVLHSELTQKQRQQTVIDFRTLKSQILISTDVLSRGLDFIVNTVVNFDFPVSQCLYIHRIGRTGRGDRRGKSYTYFTKQDRPYLRSVVNVMKESGQEVQEWMLELKKPSQKQRKLIKRHAPDRRNF